jgi:hypothetical protein
LVSAALSGRPISASSLALIAKALAETPPAELIDRLLFMDSSDPGPALAG